MSIDSSKLVYSNAQRVGLAVRYMSRTMPILSICRQWLLIVLKSSYTKNNSERRRSNFLLLSKTLMISYHALTVKIFDIVALGSDLNQNSRLPTPFLHVDLPYHTDKSYYKYNNDKSQLLTNLITIFFVSSGSFSMFFSLLFEHKGLVMFKMCSISLRWSSKSNRISFVTVRLAVGTVVTTEIITSSFLATSLLMLLLLDNNCSGSFCFVCTDGIVSDSNQISGGRIIGVTLSKSMSSGEESCTQESTNFEPLGSVVVEVDNAKVTKLGTSYHHSPPIFVFFFRPPSTLAASNLDIVLVPLVSTSTKSPMYKDFRLINFKENSVLIFLIFKFLCEYKATHVTTQIIDFRQAPRSTNNRWNVKYFVNLNILIILNDNSTVSFIFVVIF
ncbi:hypothetical protein AGLY_012407 [Aphis glycines]|uniref:Uncharacterized protein n=1 Tax=Aphis glycines TaxID=307491 RepID=A0A6G0TAX0_APHGL|nr:hypothetical protein AGLY_012407 [Aphis glycines]